MARQNFSWGVHGQGTEGVDYGNTNAWDEGKWQQYEREHGITPEPVKPPSTPDPSGGGFLNNSQPKPITTGSQVTSTSSNVGGSTSQGQPTTVAQSFQQALVNRLNPQPLTAQNDAIAPAIQANKLAEQRGFERNRNLLAERAAAQGTNNSGGFETDLLGLAQNRAGREAAFEGNAVQNLARQQSQDLTSALMMGGNLLGEQERMALQKQLADLDAQLRREGLGAQTSLGNRDIDLRGRLGEGQLNLGLLQALLGNEQFGRSLAQNGAQFGASLDQSGILGILSML